MSFDLLTIVQIVAIIVIVLAYCVYTYISCKNEIRRTRAEIYSFYHPRLEPVPLINVSEPSKPKESLKNE